MSEYKYNKPSLLEMYAGVKLTKAKLSVDSWFGLFPKFQSIGLGLPEISSSIDLSVGGHTLSAASTGFRCWNESKTRLVQISASEITVNFVKDYPGWASFYEFLKKVLKVVNEVKKVDISSISLTAKNEAVIADGNFMLGSYLICDGELIPKKYQNSRFPSDISLGEGILEADNFNEQVRVAVRKNGETVTLQFDLSFKKPLINGQEYSDLLNDLHDLTLSRFEKVISEKYRKEVLGGLHS
ncbi:MAG: TIGR04255 family protein [Oligoflexales bacterium]